MKKIIFALVILLNLGFCFAQEEKQDDELTSISIEQDVSASLIGTWKNPKGGLIVYIDFYDDGTGKVYPQSVKNSTSFTWSVEDNILVMKGGFKNKSEFSLEGDTLTFKRLNTFKNPVYTRIEE